MLIEEIIKKKTIFLEGLSPELRDDIDDILLRARIGNIPNLNINDLAGELNKSTEIYINPRDPEFKNNLINYLQKSDVVKGISPTGNIILKKIGGKDKPDKSKPGNEIEKERNKLKQKVQKTASKNVRDKAKRKSAL